MSFRIPPSRTASTPPPLGVTLVSEEPASMRFLSLDAAPAADGHDRDAPRLPADVGAVVPAAVGIAAYSRFLPALRA